MATYEGLWDCRYCGKTGIRGSSLNCDGCGVPRDKDVEFYLPGDAPPVKDPELLKRAAAGPDWRCSYCGKDNPSGQEGCSGCGAHADGTEGRRQVRRVGAPPPRGDLPPGGSGKRGLSCFAAGCLILLGLTGFLFLVSLVVLGVLVFTTHDEVLTATGHEWTRSLDIEKYKLVTREAWEGSVPAGAEELSSRREVYDTRRVRTGSHRVRVGRRDRGNGFFEDVYEDRATYREDRIYKNKITYRIWDWVFDRTVEDKGRDENPRWPPDPADPKERVSKRRQKYVVRFVNDSGDGREHETQDEAEWAGFKRGGKYAARVNLLGGIMSFEKGARAPAEEEGAE